MTSPRPSFIRLLSVAIIALLVAGAGAVALRPASTSATATVEAALAPTQNLDREDAAPRSIETASVDVVTPADTAGLDAIAPPPETFEGEAEAAPVDIPLPSAPVAVHGTGVWALVIGIDDYPGSSGDLRSAVNDARDFELALDLFGVPDSQRNVLINRAATASNIVQGLDWLTANAGPDATAVVFYAGHVRKVAARSESIVGADGGTVSDTMFASRLARLQAEQAWIVMAACYGGGFDEALAPGRILTAGAGPNDLAYENSKFGRSYLVQFLIREAWLEGRAGSSVQHAYAYAVDTLSSAHPDRLPFQSDRLGEPLVLGTRATPAPAPEHVEQAPASSGSSNSSPDGSDSANEPAPSGDGSSGSTPPPSNKRGDDGGSETECKTNGLLIRSCR